MLISPRPLHLRALCQPSLSLLVTGALLSGCGGGGGGSTGGGGGGTITTPDMGVLGSISDANGFTLTNVSSGMVLGIANQSQVAGICSRAGDFERFIDNRRHVACDADGHKSDGI